MSETGSRYNELGAAAYEAHRVLTETHTDEAAIALLVAAAKRALHHYERLRGDKEDTPLMWDLRRAIRSVQRNREIFEAWP